MTPITQGSPAQAVPFTQHDVTTIGEAPGLLDVAGYTVASTGSEEDPEVRSVAALVPPVIGKWPSFLLSRVSAKTVTMTIIWPGVEPANATAEFPSVAEAVAEVWRLVRVAVLTLMATSVHGVPAGLSLASGSVV